MTYCKAKKRYSRMIAKATTEEQLKQVGDKIHAYLLKNKAAVVEIRNELAWEYSQRLQYIRQPMMEIYVSTRFLTENPINTMVTGKITRRVPQAIFVEADGWEGWISKQEVTGIIRKQEEVQQDG